MFPSTHIRHYAEESLRHLKLERIDLLQLHVWDDAWASDDGWQGAAEALKRDGLIGAFGISVNRWQPENVLRALETGLVDAVQVVYNIFDQAPEDVLFPACRARGVAVIARVPFDEGHADRHADARQPLARGRLAQHLFLSGQPGRQRRRGPRHWRRSCPRTTHARPGPALHPRRPDVATVIPGMRKARHVEANLAASDRGPVPPQLLKALRAHRWGSHRQSATP